MKTLSILASVVLGVSFVLTGCAADSDPEPSTTQDLTNQGSTTGDRTITADGPMAPGALELGPNVEQNEVVSLGERFGADKLQQVSDIRQVQANQIKAVTE